MKYLSYKNKLSLVILLAFGMFMSACQDDEFAPAKYEYVGLNSSNLAATVSEGTDEPVDVAINVTYGGEMENTRGAIEVTLRVDQEGSTAVLGEDYLINGGTSPEFTVTIPADAKVGTFTITTIPNEEIRPEGESKTIKVDLVSNNANLGTGYPLSTTHTIEILDDDCAYDAESWVGTFSTNEPGYGDYDNEIVQDPNDPNTFIISNFWDFGGTVRYVFDPESKSVTLPQQDVVMGGDTYVVEGSGTYEQCLGMFMVDYTVTEGGALLDDNTHTFTKVE